MEKRVCRSVKRGFTLVELLVIIGIISILASVVLVGMSGARTKSKDNAAFTQVTSTQGLTAKCITSGVANVVIDSPNVAPAGTTCSSGGSAVAGFPDWPALSANNGWAYASNFHWCNVNVSYGASAPSGANISLTYNDATGMGGSRASGKFCYRLRSGTIAPMRYIWCTESGCGKQGF